MATPAYDKSIEFLKRFHPGRRWVLTSIHPEKLDPKTCTATFDETRTKACIKWLEEQGATRNIYFSVGEVVRDTFKKAERTDIANVWWLHVDIDPRAGEPVAAEQERILKLLMQPPGILLPPTVITFSGGGYQGFWKLDQPLPINCELAKAETAKLFNLKIEQLLGADNCHNIDRIMRLPGSVNRPDAKKIAKGRVEAVSEVINFADTVFNIAQFVPAADIPKAAAKTADPTAPKMAAPVSVARVMSLDDDLPQTVSKRVKIVVAQGNDPENPQKFPSRSEWLFFAVCGLVKGGVKDDVIFSILTDPKWGISSSVIEKGNKAEKYALRQIERAQQETVHPWLHALNERFAVIESMNGKCRVIEEQFDEGMKRSRIARQTFDDFQNRFMNIAVEMGFNDDGKPISKPLGIWWLMHQHRRQYQRMIFAPNQDVPEAYNMWRGFAVEPKAGSCELFLQHVRDIICCGNTEHYQYIMGWMARAIQKPDEPGHSAIILKGDQGTGKSLFVKTFGSLFGRHFMQVTDPKHLVGSFNSHLRDCVVLFGDEAFFAGDKKHESILKMLITEEMLTIEAKGIDAEQSRNYVHLLMASNDAWVVPAGVGDRRFFVLNISRERKEDTLYFEALANEIDNGGREALLHYLMNYNLKGFEVRNIPKTEELQQQKLYSLPAEEMWWKEKLTEGRLLPEHGNWKDCVPFSDLYYDYLIHCRTTSNGFRRATRSNLKVMLRKYLPKGRLEEFNAAGNLEVMDSGGNRVMAETPLMVRFPTIADCREAWSVQFGGKVKWGENDIGEQIDLYKEYR